MQLQEMYRIRKPLYDQFADISVLNNTTPEAVVAVVDFTDAQLGTYTIKSNITLSGAFSSIGAIGSYSVSVTVRSAPN